MGRKRMIEEIRALIEREGDIGTYEFYDDGDEVCVNEFEIYGDRVFFSFSAFPSGECEQFELLEACCDRFLKNIFNAIFKRGIDRNLF